MVVIPEELYMTLQRGKNRKQPCTSREKENKQVCLKTIRPPPVPGIREQKPKKKQEIGKIRKTKKRVMKPTHWIEL